MKKLLHNTEVEIDLEELSSAGSRQQQSQWINNSKQSQCKIEWLEASDEDPGYVSLTEEYIAR